MRKIVKCLGIIAGTAFLAACQTRLPEPASLPPPVPCPPVSIDNIALHQGGLTGALTGVDAMCHRIGGNLSVNLDVAFAASRRHAGIPYRFVLPYTVTIVEEGGGTRSHELYHVALLFPAGATGVAQHEHLHQVIPVTQGNANPSRITLSLDETGQ